MKQTYSNQLTNWSLQLGRLDY